MIINHASCIVGAQNNRVIRVMRESEEGTLDETGGTHNDMLRQVGHTNTVTSRTHLFPYKKQLSYCTTQSFIQHGNTNQEARSSNITTNIFNNSLN